MDSSNGGRRGSKCLSADITETPPKVIQKRSYKSKRVLIAVEVPDIDVNKKTSSSPSLTSIFNVKEETEYNSDNIPGLDLLTVNDEDKDSDGNKIRRSSRIKEQRGSRGRRREVVFSTSSVDTSLSRSMPNLNDEDSCSNSSSCLQSGGSSPSQDYSMSSGISSDGSTSESCSPIFGSSLSLEHDSAIDSDVIDALIQSKKLTKKPGHLLFKTEDNELIDKLKKFQGIEKSIFQKERKISKESRGMVCDCFLTNEEAVRGDPGCIEDCLNRLLMVECGPRCPTGESCQNRKFQREDYATLEVFKTEKKGHGLRTLQSISQGGFVIEYVGEVLDPWQFESRTTEYAKQNQEHSYFMALQSDSIIDATTKGNCSRFINHSCEPNCEAQKWTVNGELRIGFFTLRDLKPGEEIVFDYQFQRYGKNAQRCYCMTPSCRGWIGEEDEQEELDEETIEDETLAADIADNDAEVEASELSEIVPKKVKRRSKTIQKKRKDTVRILEDVTLEEELSQLRL